MQKSWKPVSEYPNLRSWQNLAKNLVGIGLFLLMILFLFGCTKTEYVYTEAPRKPITCHKHIKTYLDVAKCLEEYKVKYND